MDEAKVRQYFSNDVFARECGIELLHVGPGEARVRMPLRPEHFNAVGIVHGGAVFTIADFAFAVASNSHGTLAVALNANINFVKAAHEGALSAEAREVTCSRRVGTYDVRVTNDAGELIALFTGLAYRKNEPLPLDANPAE